MTHPSIRQIELVETDQIIPFHANARTHSKKQINKIARSMQQRGVTNPLLIDEDNVLLAGHGRLAAAVHLGLRKLPCIRMSGMSEEDKRGYRLADNQLALEAGWDFELLAGELQFLVDADFDVGLTGFDDAEVDIILTEQQARSVDPASPDDEISPVAPGVEAVTRDGDLWILGSHRLLCGNARSGAALDRLMEEERADMAFTDAPYNVPINGHVGGNGRTRHREFAEASGEMTPDAYREFLRATLGNLARSCRDGAIVYSCIDWRHLPDILAVGAELFTELKNLCVWNKTNAGMGSFYRSQHELVTVWKAGQAGHINNFGLGERGRHRSNVWTYAGVNTFRPGRIEELELHPTVKPVAMVADAIRDVSHRGQIVLDVFGGSGTTLIAAEKTGRYARLLEIDPLYCDAIVGRWEKQSGKPAVLAGQDLTFEEVAQSRRIERKEAEQ
ncbi:site-specific DNA-methyltransferase [Edaphosphingomonas haloaromaticamans]|uniref:site-specific DNA-methyltransferase (adenine-specific) n=1 Tax=Edaphosphingomonas haloaromaticamans TaxID=653954 RepID=A0A1S1HAX8_9SPHN|nr:site-specific DNA-methyltransferase [Sphingomonas haloaromaticamans]OHT18591.1 putative methyltransferase [Sphingomonas haloaromaticamans]